MRTATPAMGQAINPNTKLNTFVATLVLAAVI
jgi:hypothetical protein